MALSDSDLRKLEPTDSRYRSAVGDGLYIEVHPHGGKYFLWKYRFPPGRKGQQRWHHIGPYGRLSKQWTLKKAKDEKDRLDALRREGEDPRTLKLEQKVATQGSRTIYFRKVSDEWIGNVSSKLANSTLRDYRSKLSNDILPTFGKRAIKTITRSECLEFKRIIEARRAKSHSDKVFGVLRRIFKYAIKLELLKGPNPTLNLNQSDFNILEESCENLPIKGDNICLHLVNPEDKEHIQILYKFICSMRFPISNIIKPSLREHIDFVKKNPYRKWFLVERNFKIIGTLYLTFENSIGINLLSDDINDYKNSLMMVMEKFKPIEPKCSIVNQYFHVHINPSNLILEEALIELGMSFIEKTYLLIPKDK